MKKNLTLNSLSIELAVRFPSLAKFLRFNSIRMNEENCTNKPVAYVICNVLHITPSVLDYNDQELAKVSIYSGLVTIISRHFLESTRQSYSDLLNEEIDYISSVVDTKVNLLYTTFDLITLNLLNVLTSMTVKSLMSNSLFDFPENTKDLLVKYNEYLNEDGYDPSSHDIVQFTAKFIRSYGLEDVSKLVSTLLNRDDDKNSACTSIYEDDIYGSDTVRAQGTADSSFSSSALSEIFVALDFMRELAELTQRFGANPMLRKFLTGYSFTLSRLVVNYESRLTDAFSGLFKDDYSFRKPNPRYLHTGMVMPSMISNSVNLLFAVDHSGSVSNSESAEQLGAVDSILASHTNHSSKIAIFSTEIRKVIEVDSNDTLVDALATLGDEIGAKGGTLFQCVFDYCESLDDLEELHMITLVSSDGSGGDIVLSKNFKDRFKGRILLLLKDNYSSQSAANAYKACLSDIEHDVIFYVPQV